MKNPFSLPTYIKHPILFHIGLVIIPILQILNGFGLLTSMPLMHFLLTNAVFFIILSVKHKRDTEEKVAK